MSFFDEGDEPRRPRPRRPSGGTVSADPQTVRVRQGVALGVGLLVLILLVVGINSCRSSAKKRSLRDYNRDVASLVQESDDQVSKPFFEQLAGAGGGDNSINLETQVNQLRVVAEDLVKRARNLDVPDEMRAAQSNLLLVLELRRDALTKIAAKLPTAQAQSGADQAVTQLTGQMTAFLASDVIYSQRVIPYIRRALDGNEITGQTIPTSQFLPSVTWLDETQVASRLGTALRGGGRRTGGAAAPGSHGHGISTVSVGGVDLSTDGANRVPAGANLTFTVKFQNQGENDEQGVPVKVSIEGSGRPVTAQAVVPTTSAGSEASVDVPLKQAPPIGAPVTINVAVDPVPGEKVTDNNKQSYPVLFTRGQ